jgi:geranylgeranyl diphosphate synthase type II
MSDAEISSVKGVIDVALLKHLGAVFPRASVVRDAATYSIGDGGRRWRPLLLMFVGRGYGVPDTELLPMACAVEFLHTVSLMLDDLPSMDNADCRRGRPACHKVYGEAVTILAAHLLQAACFEADRSSYQTAYTSELTELIGDMAVGQAGDLSIRGTSVARAEWERVSRLKSGRLFGFSAKMGAVLGNAPNADARHLERFGEDLGFAYQMLDDVVDGDGYALDACGSSHTYNNSLTLVREYKRSSLAVLDGVNINTGMLKVLVESLLPVSSRYNSAED